LIFTTRDCPVVYADFAATVSRNGGAIKFYLVRFDPSITADGTNQTEYVAQIILPALGFVNLATFFDAQLKEMLNKGEVKLADVEQARKHFEK
jgi:hypothetical protein